MHSTHGNVHTRVDSGDGSGLRLPLRGRAGARSRSQSLQAPPGRLGKATGFPAGRAVVHGRANRH